MKKLLGILVLGLFLITPSQADDIQDFQIEGMSIRDSLLNYMSEEEIKESIIYIYPDKKFTVSKYKKFTKLYDGGINVEYRSKDKTYKIYGVVGVMNFNNNIESCYKKQDEIEKDISSMFKKSKIKKFGIAPSWQGNESTYKQTQFYVASGDALSVDCYNFPNNPKTNHLKVTITSKELQKYLMSLE